MIQCFHFSINWTSHEKYLKAFILFPLIIQIIGTVALTFSNNDTDQIQSSVLSVFIVAAVPTFLITLWAAFHRYASYNVKAIALIAGLIGFSYTVVAGFFYATLVNDMGFGEWLRAGGLEITCLMAQVWHFILLWYYRSCYRKNAHYKAI